MNIKQAKEQIKNTMVAYFTKDEYGNYALPIHQQRPVFLMGAPGIGKTAIMEQIASELKVGLISYSMTHHTRQSAIGLPFIEKKIYGGKEYSVSEYTMSEIIASVFDMIESTGLKEGILFLDEVNCVSETLAPAMLQFLQYKVFGKHRIPDGWIIVTAGNPPEYNSSVREFDIVTWDRLLKIEIEPDFDAWKEYAYKTMTHPAVMSYLESAKKDFYKVESTVGGKNFVTARGWSDLSVMIKLFEKNGLDVDKNLISQLLQDPIISKNFAHYYNLFKKYNSDYKVSEILEGKGISEIIARAKLAKFDERLAVLSLLLGGLSERLEEVNLSEKVLNKIFDIVKELKKKTAGIKDFSAEILEVIDELNRDITVGVNSSSLSSRDVLILRRTIKFLEDKSTLFKVSSVAEGFGIFKNLLVDLNKEIKDKIKKGKANLTNAFTFVEQALGEHEMVIFVTELTANYFTATFIGLNGCEEYYKHNKELLFYERQVSIMDQINGLFDDEN